MCEPGLHKHNHKHMNALGNMQTSQEYFTTIVYAKFGGQTECIMDNWKIVNAYVYAYAYAYAYVKV